MNDNNLRLDEDAVDDFGDEVEFDEFGTTDDKGQIDELFARVRAARLAGA